MAIAKFATPKSELARRKERDGLIMPFVSDCDYDGANDKRSVQMRAIIGMVNRIE